MSINDAKAELAMKALDAAMTIAKSRKRGFTYRTVLGAFNPIFERLTEAADLGAKKEPFVIVVERSPVGSGELDTTRQEQESAA